MKPINQKKFPCLAQALDLPILRDASVEFVPLLTGDQDDPYTIDEPNCNLLLPDLTLEEYGQLPQEPFDIKVQQSYEDPVRGTVTFWFDFNVKITGSEPNPDGSVTPKYEAELKDYEYGL